MGGVARAIPLSSSITARKKCSIRSRASRPYPTTTPGSTPLASITSHAGASPSASALEARAS